MHRLTITLAVALISSSAWALQIAGIEMPDSLQTPSQTSLQLNGAGVREKWFMDLYVGGLYLAQPQQDADTIIHDKEPMAIRLHVISNMITSKKMTAATLEGFDDSTQGNAEAFADEIAVFLNAFADEIKEGDVFEFIYQPETGVAIVKNGVTTQTIRSGLDFKTALFGIWLSDKPAQKSLKQSMLNAD